MVDWVDIIELSNEELESLEHANGTLLRIVKVTFGVLFELRNPRVVHIARPWQVVYMAVLVILTAHAVLDCLQVRHEIQNRVLCLLEDLTRLLERWDEFRL